MGPDDDVIKSLETALDVAQRFGVKGGTLRVTPLGRGLINDTYLVEQDVERWVLQRLNLRVFGNPDAIMDNLHAIDSHVQAKSLGVGALRLPRPLSTHDGHRLYRNVSTDECWRAITYIDHSVSLEAITRPTQAFEVGRALGSFHGLLDDLSASALHDTLPGFHEAPQYLSSLDRRIASLPSEPRSEAVLNAIDFINARRGLVPVLEAAKQRGDLPLVIMHGDPKLDNVLFDRVSERAISLIDLDTVKPGLRHYDLGDCFRSCCNAAGEGKGEPVVFDIVLFEALLEGYFSVARGFFSRRDVEYLFDAIRLLPLELGIRFLEDHLGADGYFKVDTPGQNLLRAQRQFHLVASIEAQETVIRSIIERLYNGGLE